MQVTKEGIELNKAELAALLAFAGSENIPVVQFEIKREGAKLRATATDGHRLVAATALEPSAPGMSGEWTVAREHLDGCRRALDAGEVCVLKIRRGHIDRAVLRNLETGHESSTIVFPESASTQRSFPNVDGVQLVQNLKGSWCALQGSFLRDLGHVSKAVGKAPITLYPSADSLAPMGFEARGEGATWQGVLMPFKVAGPGDVGDDDEDEPDRLNPELDQALDQLHSAANELGADITVTAGKNKVTVAEGRKPKLQKIGQQKKGKR